MKIYINVYVFTITVKKLLQKLKIVQEDGKKKFICKSRKCSVVLDLKLNACPATEKAMGTL